MKLQDIKTIDIQGKKWFDRVNGNSYFSARVTINFGLENEKTVFVPFQYGYGDSYKHTSIEALREEGLLPDNTPSWECFEKHCIILRSSLRDKCLKREVIAWGSN